MPQVHSLESAGDEAAAAIRDFLARRLEAPAAVGTSIREA
jgi:hypothetical protein